MSPFRSESEQVKEQLRRAEERILELGEEKADLQRQIDIGRRSRWWLVACAGAMAASGGLGFLVASIDAQRTRVRYEQEMISKVNEATANELACAKKQNSTEAELAACNEVLHPRAAAPPSRYVPGPADCHCEPGDPLCACVPGAGAGRAFDRGAAAKALGSIIVESCKRPEGPEGDGHITVTFAPSGDVSSAVIDSGAFAGTVTGGCVAGKFRGARVPPFDGAPVRVGKAFTIH